MMLTYLAKGGSEFFYDPNLQGEIWISGPQAPETIVIPAIDLLAFCAHAAGVPKKGSEAETDELLRILDACGVFDKRQSREETRKRLHERLSGRD